MNFLFGGSENPIEKERFQVKELVEYHGLKDSWDVLSKHNQKVVLELKKVIVDFQDIMKDRRLENFTELVELLQAPYSDRSTSKPIHEAIKIYSDKNYAKQKYGIVGWSEENFDDLESLKNKDIEPLDDNIEKVLEELAEAEYEQRPVSQSINNKLLYGEKWIGSVSEKITNKMNGITMKLFNLDIWDFNESVRGFIDDQDGVDNSGTSRQSSSSRSTRSRSRSRSRSRRRSRSRSRARSSSQPRSRSVSRSRSGSQGRRSRSRSRSSSRFRSRSGSQGSRRSRSRSRSSNRSRSRSGSQGARSSRSRRNPRSRSASQDVSDLERRLSQLQQATPQENSNSSERRIRNERENENFRELERRFLTLQEERPVSRRLFD